MRRFYYKMRQLSQDATFITKCVSKNWTKSKFFSIGIAFDGAGQWSYCSNFARNVIIFGVDDSSSSHTDNPKNNF